MKSKKGLFLAIAILFTICIMLLAPYKVMAEDAMSAEFKSLLNEEGKLVFNSIKPTTIDEWYICFEGLFMDAIEKSDLFPGEYLAEDFSAVDLRIHYGEENEETHRVEIVYNYDEKMKDTVKKYADAIPENLEYFYVNDMELVNYWINGQDDVGNLVSYSGELKKYLDYKNFKIDLRMGGYEPFITYASGIADFMYDGVIYAFRDRTGVWANHIIYVPENTGDTKEELISAVQKRIEEIGAKDKIQIEYAGKISELKEAEIAEYNRMIAEYEDKLNTCINEINEINKKIEENQAIIDSNQPTSDIEARMHNIQNEISVIEELKINEIDETKLIEYDKEINELQTEFDELNEKLLIVNTAKVNNEQLTWKLNEKNNEKTMYVGPKEELELQKQYYIDQIENEDGDKYFLKEAAGDNYFTATVGDFVYNFIVIKDTEKMITPTVKTSDVKTDVTISTLNPSLPLDTTISVNRLTSGEEYEKIIKILGVNNSETFDLTLYSGSLDKNITKLDNGKFEVKIPISKAFEGKTLVVYYVDENEKVTEYEVTVKEGYAIFTTDHFSIYTLAEKKADDEQEKDNKEEVEEEKYTISANDFEFTFTKQEGYNFKASVKSIWNLKDEELASFNMTKEEYVKTKNKLTEKLKTHGTILDVIDITIFDEGKDISHSGATMFKIKMTEKMKKYNSFKLIYITDELKADDIAIAKVEGDYIVGELKHLSSYALVGSVVEETVDSSNNPKTGDNIWIFVGLLGFAVVGIVATIKLNKTSKKIK